MSREYRLQKLLHSRRVWHPGKFSAARCQPLATGFPELDEWLGGGWPANVLIEFLLNEPGIGELRLLMPALAHLSQPKESQPGASADIVQSSRIAWLAPPFIPYAPALAQHGLDIASMLVVQSAQQNDTLWAMEQILHSSLCAGVLAWVTDVDDRSMRRLQLAAESAMCWTILFRHQRFAGRASPAALRMQLAPTHNEIGVHILRNRFGRVGALAVQC
jgi:cell division inhibitor SulA/protein ImuA